MCLPKSVAIVATIELIADAGGWVLVAKIRRAEQLIPDTERDPEIYTEAPPFVPNADAVVHPVELRADQKVFERAKVPAQIGVRQGFHEPEHGKHQRELLRRQADGQRDGRHPERRDQVVEDVYAVIRPERHLLLRMVHRVQLPPPLDAVLPAVPPKPHRRARG